MHWKLDWLLTSLLSLAFVLAGVSNALQSLVYKAYNWNASTADWRTSTAHRFFLRPQIHSGLTYFNQIAGIIAQPNIFNFIAELTQLNAFTLKAQTSLNIESQLARYLHRLIMASLPLIDLKSDRQSTAV